jgi:hypothetical protein
MYTICRLTENSHEIGDPKAVDQNVVPYESFLKYGLD